MERDRVAYFDKIYEMYKKAIYRYLCYLTRDRSESDDLFQETWLRVVTKLDQIDDIQKIKPWLYTVATNVYRDQLRRKQVRRSFLDSRRQGEPDHVHVSPRDMIDPVMDFERREAADAIMGAVERLPVKMRQVFVLREIEGLNYEEIGLLLKLPSGTAKSRMHRAIRRMRQDLSSRYDGSDICLGEIK